MRMIGLALLVFMLAGISIAVSRLNLIDLASHQLLSPSVELVFEPQPATQEDERTVSLVRSRPSGVVLLGRSTPAQTSQFQMLQDSIVTSGFLNLRATAQISDGQSILLRVLVGNQIRGEILLRPGQQVIDTDIGLTSDDLANDELAIRYALTSPDGVGACSQDSTSSSVVEIEHDTRVVLDVENAKLTPRDQVAAWGNEVLVGWPNWLSLEERLARSDVALDLTLLGYDVRYVDAPNTETMSVEEMRVLYAQGSPIMRTQPRVEEWPEYVGQSGANAGMRTFHESTTWRHWYRIGPDNHSSSPNAFEYELLLGHLPDGAQWTVVITHNDSVVALRDVPGSATTIQGQVSLRDEVFQPSNVIEVSAISSYESIGLCNDGPELIAEMRPSTRLIGGGEEYANDLAELKTALSLQDSLSVGLPEQMSLIEMQRMQDLFAELSPELTDLRIAEYASVFSIVRRADYETFLPQLSSDAFVTWLDETNRVISVRAAELDQLGGAWPHGALALIADFGVSDQSTRLIRDE